MRILIAGASGMIGRALTPVLAAAGHEVVRLVRRAAQSRDEVAWAPANRQLDAAALEGAGAVVNLSGVNVGGRWTAKRRDAIFRSRVDATQTLVAAMAGAPKRPRALINASAVGYYGDRGNERLTEQSPVGQGFMPEVCLAWETHAEGAARLGVRVARLRFGVVLSREGGALAKMKPLFKLGLGGRLGNGRQWMSWVSVDDVVRVIAQAVTDERLSGAVNVVAPESVPNADFAAALAGALSRPAVLPAPAWALRLAFGQMADEALLASARAVPARLEELGFQFRHATLDSAFAAVV